MTIKSFEKGRKTYGAILLRNKCTGVDIGNNKIKRTTTTVNTRFRGRHTKIHFFEESASTFEAGTTQTGKWT